jgi:hypothetical protein
MPKLEATAPSRRRPLAALSAASVLTLLLTADLGHAQEPEHDSRVRYERKSKKTRAKADLLDTKFEAEKQAADEQRRRGVEMMEGRAFVAKTKAIEQEMADKQIEFLEKLIRSSDPDDPDYPDYLFRLADHHLEKKAYFDLQAGALYQQIYDAKQAGDDKLARTLEQRQAEHQRAAKRASHKAAQTYAALVDNPKFAAYARLDEALYYYAFELGELGDEQEMTATYQRLINDHPRSPYVANAYLAFADYYYAKGELGDAVRLYERVSQFKNSPVYAYALYKLAWCHLNPIGEFEARYDKSLNYFVATIDATKAGRAGSDANARQLRRDARRDLVRAYVHASKPSKAWSFFEQVGEGPGKDEHEAKKMMELLATAYFGDGQYTESSYIYERLQTQFPEDPLGCEWQSKIVINTLASDNHEVQWQATQKLASYYDQLATSEHGAKLKKRCKASAQSTLEQMATVWHDEADKTKHARTYELAADAYRLFLATFPHADDAYELQYYYAELLWALASQHYDSEDPRARARGLEYFREAHEQFVKALELDPEGKFTADAAYAQMLAMKNHLEYDETGALAKGCVPNSEGVCVDEGARRRQPREREIDAERDFPETEYTAEEAQMLAAYDTYTKFVDAPDDPELPKIMYHRAKLMMAHNKFDEVEPVLVEMVTKFDQVEGAQIYAAWCSAMLLDLLTIRWLDADNSPSEILAHGAELEQWATKLQGMAVWKHAESASLRASVPRLLAAIGWREAMAHREAGVAYLEGEAEGDPEGFEKCAAKFIEVFNNYENHDRADTLLWNAAECSDAAYQVGQAIQIRTALLERFPDSEHAKDTLHHLAESYQAVAYYDESAQRYEEFAAAHTKDERAADALQNAYLFRLGLGQEEQAKQDLTSYESLYKRNDIAKAAKIFWSQHDLLDSRAARRQHAKQYLDTYGTRGGVDRAVVAEAVIGQIDWRRACDEPLLYDSCITIDRKRALSGVALIEARKQMEEAQKQAEARAAAGERQRFRPPKHCGSPTQGIITVHRRSKKRSAAAQARFARVLKLVGKGTKIALPEDDPKRAEDFKNAWAMAMIYRADEDYERYLRISMPEDLDFVVEGWRKSSGVAAWERKYAAQVKKAADSKKRVEAFFTKKMGLAEALEQRYAAVIQTGSPYWTLAAAARTASVMQNFADQLYRAEVPADFKTQDQVWAYCDALADMAEPIQKKALAAYEYCIERSTQYQFFNEFSRLCEEEMQQRDAETYPATNELFGVSVYTASRIDEVGVIEDPLGGRANPLVQQRAAADEH